MPISAETFAFRGDTPRLANQVFALLRDEIVRGILPPGTPMAELDLCNRMHVSRTPVREALIKLAEEGLVTIYPQRGTFVAAISLDALRDAQFIREHLECGLAAEAVRCIDATGMRQLQAIVERQERAQRDNDPEAFYDLDEAFHNEIARIAGRPGVWQVIVQAKVQFDRVRYLSLHEARQISLLIGQHREIAEALGDCDEVRAVAAVRRHLREVFRTLDDLSPLIETAPAPPLRRRRLAKDAG